METAVGTVNYPKSRRSVGRVNLGGIIDMAGFTKDLMGGQGCSVDGLAQARNPMGQFVDAMFQGPQGAKGQMVGPRGPMVGPGASMHAAMRQGFAGPQARGPMGVVLRTGVLTSTYGWWWWKS